jgi:hypothetical protein
MYPAEPANPRGSSGIWKGYGDEPPERFSAVPEAHPPPTLAWSVRNGQREGKDRLGIRCAEFEEAEAQPGDR